MNGEQDVLNCDVGVPRREAGVGGNVEHPGEIANTKPQIGQWWAGGGLGKDGWREVWIGLRGYETHVVLEVGRDDCGVKVHARGQRCGWDIGEGVCLRGW